MKDIEQIDLSAGKWPGFLAFIVERHSIWHRRRDMSRPWTTDPILASGKFGNVWRALDRGTQWETAACAAIDRGISRNGGSRIRSLTARMAFVALYRHNLIPQTTWMLLAGESPTEIGMEASWQVMHDAIKIWPRVWVEKVARPNAPDSPINCTRMVMPESLDDLTRIEWAVYCDLHAKDVIDAMPVLAEWARYPESMDLHAVWKAIQMLMPRLGEFKAYEVLTSWASFDDWPYGESSFVHVGHGALPMLRSLMTDRHWSSAEKWDLEPYAEALMGPLAVKVGNEIFDRLTDLEIEPPYAFTERTLEDCLCEYRKYVQVGEGRRQNRSTTDPLGRDWTPLDRAMESDPHRWPFFGGLR
jgi:hypothetical protein